MEADKGFIGALLTVLRCILLALLLTSSSPGQAAEEPLPSAPGDAAKALEEAASKVVEQTGPHTFKVGKIRVDAKSRAIEFPAKVNMTEGLIEVILCTPYGKTHESIFVADVSPFNLHVALLLLGLKPGRNPGWYVPPGTAPREENKEAKSGPLVDVYAAWETPDGKNKLRAEAFLKDIRTGKPLPDTHWVFTGSIVDAEGDYFAQTSGSILTNYHDRTSVLDNPLEIGRVDDYTYARTQAIPPIGTSVRVTIIPAGKEGEEKKDDS